MELLPDKNQTNDFGVRESADKSFSVRNNPRGGKILVLFGTRPEAIKLAPVIRELKAKKFHTVVVSSGQHTDLLAPFVKLLEIECDYNLGVMTKNQSPNEALSKTLAALDEVLECEKPDFIFVQGDTTTTLAGALAGFHRKIPVGHVEAGLRSGNLQSPFPEEMNRRMISQIAAFHFCATEENKQNLLGENISADGIFVTGNTVVDSLNWALENLQPGENIRRLLAETKDLKRILLTTHRRESFGEPMRENLIALRSFVENHRDACLIFPVHPNPNVRSATGEILADCERIFLIEPVDYADFIALMKAAWLIVSDSGGVQEEAPSLGKPLLILRENTERPEAIEAGIAKLVDASPKNLAKLLEENYNDESWVRSAREIENPFGTGDAAEKIVQSLVRKLNARIKIQK